MHLQGQEGPRTGSSTRVTHSGHKTRAPGPEHLSGHGTAANALLAHLQSISTSLTGTAYSSLSFFSLGWNWMDWEFLREEAQAAQTGINKML